MKSSKRFPTLKSPASHQSPECSHGKSQELYSKVLSTPPHGSLVHLPVHLLNWSVPDELLASPLLPDSRRALLETAVHFHRRFPQRFALPGVFDWLANTSLLVMSGYDRCQRSVRCGTFGHACGERHVCPYCSYLWLHHALHRFTTLRACIGRLWWVTIVPERPLMASEDYLSEEPKMMWKCVHEVMNTAIRESLYSGSILVHEWALNSLLPEEKASPHVHALILADDCPDAACLKEMLDARLFLVPWRVKLPWVVKVESEAHLLRVLRYPVKPINFVEVYRNSIVDGVDMGALNAAVSNAVAAFESICHGQCGISYLGAFHHASRGFVGVSKGAYGKTNREKVKAWKLHTAQECFDPDMRDS